MPSKGHASLLASPRKLSRWTSLRRPLRAEGASHGHTRCPMGRVAVRKMRSGDDARGGARINHSEELPNTATAAWAEKFMGTTSTVDCVGIFGGVSHSTPVQTLGELAAVLHLPRKVRDGVGHGRGKTPRTILKRLVEAVRSYLAACHATSRPSPHFWGRTLNAWRV